MCGFRQYLEIRRFLKDVPELRQVVTEGLAEAFCQAVDNNSIHQIQKFAIKACFSSMYDREEAFVKATIKDMMARLKKTLGRGDSGDVRDYVRVCARGVWLFESGFVCVRARLIGG